MYKLLSLASIPLAVILLSACTSQPTTLPPGKYESSSKSFDAQGTERKTESTTEVYYDEYGNKKATVDKKTTTDPKGLFNKSTTEHRTTVD